MTFKTLFSNIFIISFIVLQLTSCKTEEPTTNSEYISKVFEYVYAPGQHAYRALSSDSINFIGVPENSKGWLFLGGFGGYIIAGFDHNIENHAGADFEVYALQGSTPEPAIVYVMQDENGDALPNETWYELKGNQYENSKRNYWLRYFKAKNDSSNITWIDSDYKTGELICGYGATNSSSWWWPDTKTDSITFYGTRLPDSYKNSGTDEAQYWTVDPALFTWGYAENNTGTDFDKSIGTNKLDISNAVDNNGKTVSLENIRFIKVQTAVFQQAGWTNEVSAEIRGAKELE